tara:strand:+ start:522 stop:1181 length:660 start_codon:yes stop_codon:yes gene_type:complete
MIKNIIFDFDGVIVDSEVLVSKAFTKFLNNLGFSVKEEELYIYAGMKTVEVIKKISSKFNIDDKKKFTDEIFKIISQVYFKDLKLVEGVEKYILNSKKNHFIGSNSNKDRIINGLKIVGMTNIFPSYKIYSFDMVQKPKPNPDIYLKVIKDNNLDTMETIVLEDSGVGVKAAKLAGLRVFGLTAGKHWHSNRDKNELYDNGALNVFNSYRDFEKALESL